MMFSIQIKSALVRYPHPILGLDGFEVSQLRFCTMHIVNLGILHNVSGSLVSLLCEHGCLDIDTTMWDCACRIICLEGFLGDIRNSLLLISHTVPSPPTRQSYSNRIFWRRRVGTSPQRAVFPLQAMGSDKEVPVPFLEYVTVNVVFSS